MGTIEMLKCAFIELEQIRYSKPTLKGVSFGIMTVLKVSELDVHTSMPNDQ
jgi:hypothetical protein